MPQNIVPYIDTGSSITSIFYHYAFQPIWSQRFCCIQWHLQWRGGTPGQSTHKIHRYHQQYDQFVACVDLFSLIFLQVVVVAAATLRAQATNKARIEALLLMVEMLESWTLIREKTPWKVIVHLCVIEHYSDWCVGTLDPLRQWFCTLVAIGGLMYYHYQFMEQSKVEWYLQLK